jgi:hypothetical protein
MGLVETLVRGIRGRIERLEAHAPKVCSVCGQQDGGVVVLETHT